MSISGQKIRFNPPSLKGAYVLEERHLQELDRIINRIGDGTVRVDVSFRPHRRQTIDSFAALGSLDLIDKYVVSSIDGTKTNREGASLSISLSGSSTSPARLNYSAFASEQEIDAFEHAIVDFQKRIKAPYSFLYNGFLSISLSISLIVISACIIYFLKIDISWIDFWKVLIFTAIAPNLTSEFMLYLLRRAFPPFVVHIGEGIRWRRKLSQPVDFILPRAIWQFVLLFATIVLSWTVSHIK